MRTTLTTGTHPDGSWLLATRPSAPALRSLVPVYVGYDEVAASAVRRLQVPHPDITVIINLGAPLRIGPAAHAPGAHARGADAPSFGSFVAGLHDAAVTTENTGPASGIELRLTPLGAWQLLQAPLSLVTNRVQTLDEVLGPAARTLEARLRACVSTRGVDWDRRFDLLDTMLLDRLRTARTIPRDVQWAWRALSDPSHGRSVGDVTAALGWSRRRLAATFREFVGLTPKTLSRIARFDRAMRAVRSGHAPSLGRLAAECGYADQAHLTREFREFTGVSPAALLRRVQPGAGGVSPD